MGLGSLAGAILILEPARRRLKPNQMTVLAGIVLAVSYALMAVVRQPQVFLIVAVLAGAAWTISASELWIAGQRIIPDWIRGRLNATHMMVSQGGISMAGLMWGALATTPGPRRKQESLICGRRSSVSHNPDGELFCGIHVSV